MESQNCATHSSITCYLFHLDFHFDLDERPLLLYITTWLGYSGNVICKHLLKHWCGFLDMLTSIIKKSVLFTKMIYYREFFRLFSTYLLFPVWLIDSEYRCEWFERIHYCFCLEPGSREVTRKTRKLHETYTSWNN